MNRLARSLRPIQIGEPITQAPTPVEVLAWILRVDGTEDQVEATATAWTPRAVNITYQDHWGRDDRAWVWAGAVTRRPAEPPRRT